jgi:hypothetical protein
MCMRFIYESPDKGKTVFRRPARIAPRKVGGDIQVGHLKDGQREMLMPNGKWAPERAVAPKGPRSKFGRKSI